MLMIEPRSIRARTTSRAPAWATRNTPERLVSIAACHVSSASSRLGARAGTPALLTTIAGAPSSATSVAMAAAMLAGSVTSIA